MRLARLERPKIESAAPVVGFAWIRLALAVVALVATLVAGFPFGGRLFVVAAAVALPWAVFVLLLALRSPRAALGLYVPIGDLAVMAVAQALVPETYTVIRLAAIFMVSAHAQFQGERIGLLLALFAVVTLVPIGIVTEDPIEGAHLHVLYEALFAAMVIGAALVVGTVRTAESAGRVRARELTRRTMATESLIRRRLAQTLHDGPVQELTSLDMMLAAAAQASAKGDEARAREAIEEARAIAVRNVEALRDEIVDLGPFAFEELSFQMAVEQCVEAWQRRFGLDVRLELEPLELAPEVSGVLFHITQEAVTNAGLHADAASVTVSLRRADGSLELSIADDGRGFGDVDPLAAREPGHIGLASMRERAEMLGGRLEIGNNERGAEVRVSAPLELASR